MKDLKYFEDKAENQLMESIRKELKSGPVVIAIDCTINKESDLEKSSIKFSLRRVWRTNGKAAFEKAKEPTHRFINPLEVMKINGVPVEKGIVLPIYAPEILEDEEINTNHMRAGLILSLRSKFDDYYYQLLTSFNTEGLSEEVIEEIENWGGGDERK